jgi:hypothetical protein
MVILDEKLIEETKVAAIRDKRKVSGIVEELWRHGWRAGRCDNNRQISLELDVQ